MKYFLHDTSSFDDEKITELFIEYGFEGLGLFYTILEKIGKQEKPIKTSVLKKQLSVGKKLEKCWSFLEELGLINSKNGETFNERILSYSETYQIKKEKNKEKISQWRENQTDTKIVTGYEPECNPPKEKKINKVNESKEKVEVVLPFENDFLVLWNNWKEYKKTEHNFKYKSVQSEQAAINELVTLAGGNEENAVAIIQQSLAKGWKGFFQLKNENNGTGKSIGAKQNHGITSEQLHQAADRHFG
jgi:hypothetical protein